MRFAILDEGSGREYAVEAGAPLRAGRDSACEIALDFEGISRRHCEFAATGDKLMVRDLGSKNGTYVNGRRIDEQPLGDGDRVTLSKRVSYKVRVLGAGEETSAMPHPAAGAVHVDPAPTPGDSGFAPARGAAAPSAGRGAQPVESSQAAPEGAGVALARVEPAALGAPVPDPLAYGVPPPVAAKPALRWLLVAAIGGFALLAILGLWLRGDPAPVAKDPRKEPEALIQQAVKAYRERRYADAAEAAKSLAPGRPWAEILRDLARAMDRAGGDPRKLDWVKSESLARELVEVRPGREVESLANEQIAWIKEEEPHMRVVLRAEALASERKWEQVLAEFEALPAPCPFRVLYSTLFADARAAYVEGGLSAARAALEKEDWSQARALYEKILPRLGDKEREQATAAMALSDRRQKENAALRELRAAFARGDFAAARVAAAHVPADSPLATEARGILQRIEGSERLAKIKELYDSGRAEEALAMIEKEKPPEATDLRQRIPMVEKALRAGEEALKKREIEEAVARWREVVRNEPYAGNFYRKSAQGRLDEWGDPGRVARTYKQWGDDHYRQDEVEKARAWYEKAESFSAGSAAAKIREMDLEATRLLNQADNMKKGNSAEALKLVERMLRLITPAHPFYSNARKLRQELLDLQGTQGG